MKTHTLTPRYLVLLLRLLGYILLAATSVVLQAAAPLKIQGSDLLRPWLAQEFADYIESGEVVLELEGSTLAMDQMRIHDADVAILAVPEGSEVYDIGYQSFPFCYLVSVVAVHKSNPIPDITLSQLGKIFGEKENFTQWSELGLGGVWASRTIRAVSVDRSQGMALEMMQSMAMPEDRLKQSVTLLENTEQVLQRLRLEPSTLGILPQTVKDDAVRLLPVAGGAGGQGNYAFSPTPENINFGDYPLRLKFSIYMKEYSDDSIRQKVRQLYSDLMAASLTQAGFVPVPKRDRERFIFELDSR